MKTVCLFLNFQRTAILATPRRFLHSHHPTHTEIPLLNLLKRIPLTQTSSPEKDEDKLLVDIFNVLKDQFQQRQLLPKPFVHDLLDSAIEKHSSLPNILKLSRPVSLTDFNHQIGVTRGDLNIVGDTHGQFTDFCEIFRSNVGGMPSSLNSYLFNGDIVDRGPMACEILFMLLIMKNVNPNVIHILRGNHETTPMNHHFGFEMEVRRKYGSEILNKFRKLFTELPIAATIENKVFVVHGGLGPKSVQMSLDEINKLNRKVEDSEPMDPISELLWGGKLALLSLIVPPFFVFFVDFL
jgi:serine/threonine-protein phosphatase 5